jgi:hypothetical protein
MWKAHTTAYKTANDITDEKANVSPTTKQPTTTPSSNPTTMSPTMMQPTTCLTFKPTHVPTK